MRTVVQPHDENDRGHNASIRTMPQLLLWLAMLPGTHYESRVNLPCFILAFIQLLLHWDYMGGLGHPEGGGQGEKKKERLERFQVLHEESRPMSNSLYATEGHRQSFFHFLNSFGNPPKN